MVAVGMADTRAANFGQKDTTLAFALSYFAMLLISMTNPGMFCPMPNALLMVAMFVVVERQPDTAAVPVKVGSVRTPERRLF